jgi:hypothetical protein
VILDTRPPSFLRATLKNWEWPGDEAKETSQRRGFGTNGVHNVLVPVAVLFLAHVLDSGKTMQEGSYVFIRKVDYII